MSDVGVFPPGAMVWLYSMAWCSLCVLALLVCLLIAWLRTRDCSRAFVRDRFAGYAMGAWASGIVAGLSMSLINWSGSLGAFSRWIDRPAVAMMWMAMVAVIGPVVGFAWNRSRRLPRV